MATRLTEGQVQLRGAGGVPMQQVVPTEVDYMTAARAEANVSNVYAQILDRMATSINKYSAELRTKEGLDWVANNPVTDIDLQLARDGVVVGLGGGIGKVSGDFPSFFNAAVRKARSEELAGHFILHASNELGKMLVQVENNELQSSDVENKIAALAGSFQKVVAKADPDAALKVAATIKTHGSTVLNKAYEVQLKREKEQRLITFDLGFNEQLRLLQAKIEQGFWVDENGQQRSVEDYVNVVRNFVASTALTHGGLAFQKEYSEKFETQLREVRKNVVLVHIVSDPNLMGDYEGTRNKIIAGDLGRVSPIIQYIKQNDPDSFVKILNSFTQQSVDVESNRRQKQEEEKKLKDRRLVELYAEWHRAGPAQRRALEAQMVPLAGTMDQLDKFLKDDKDNKGDPLVRMRLKDEIKNNRITDPGQLLPYFNRGQINPAQLNELQEFIYSTEKPQIAAAEQTLRRFSGVPDNLTSAFDPKSSEFVKHEKLKQRFDDLVRIEQDKQRALPPEKRTGVDYEGIANQVTKGFRENDVAIDRKKDAQAKLEKISAKAKEEFGVNVTINANTSMADLMALEAKRKKDILPIKVVVFTKDELKRIEKLINILKE
jgi:hypothetical protein